MASSIFRTLCTTSSGRLSNGHCVCYLGVLLRQKVASQMWINWPDYLWRSVLSTRLRNL